MHLSVMTRISDVDESYILPWLLHYSKLGFDSAILNDFTVRYQFLTRNTVEHWQRLCSPMEITVISSTNKDPLDFWPGSLFFLKASQPSIHESFSNDWIFHIDTDEYIYSPTSFRQFLSELPPHVYQVQLFWIMIENIHGHTHPHPYDAINAMPWFSNPHVKSGSRLHSSLVPVGVHKWEVPFGKSTWVHSSILPVDHDLSVYPEYLDNLMKYKNVPFIFHLHTQSFKNVLFKISLHNSLGISDDSQRLILHDAIINTNPRRLLDLQKWILSKAHRGEHVMFQMITHDDIGISSTQPFALPPLHSIEDRVDLKKENELFETLFPTCTQRKFLEDCILQNAFPSLLT
uniref:Uncharacterized protein n=1 Tax=viral metagenome TaxID=1070528 RepID=A0A6C0D171_9ZZZZ